MVLALLQTERGLKGNPPGAAGGQKSLRICPVGVILAFFMSVSPQSFSPDQLLVVALMLF